MRYLTFSTSWVELSAGSLHTVPLDQVLIVEVGIQFVFSLIFFYRLTILIVPSSFFTVSLIHWRGCKKRWYALGNICWHWHLHWHLEAVTRLQRRHHASWEDISPHLIIFHRWHHLGNQVGEVGVEAFGQVLVLCLRRGSLVHGQHLVHQGREVGHLHCVVHELGLNGHLGWKMA